MKYIKLETGCRLTVDQFENNTNKSYPYYQDGKKYALCPACGSSVQIIGGINNLTQNKERKMYAAHTRSKHWCDAGSSRSPSGMTASPSN